MPHEHAFVCQPMCDNMFAPLLYDKDNSSDDQYCDGNQYQNAKSSYCCHVLPADDTIEQCAEDDKK